MSLTVRQLIAKLRKMPQDAFVGWQDHDQAEHELNALVGVVEEADPRLRRSHNVGVVIRP